MAGPEAPNGGLAGSGAGATPEYEGRLAKVRALRESGTEPYPTSFERTAVAADLHQKHAGLPPESATGEVASVAGRLVQMRNLGKLAFAVLLDWSGRIQLYADAATLGDRYPRFAELDLGDWVGATGEIVTTRTGELSVKVEELTLLAKSLHPLPEKWHGVKDVEKRYRQRYLDLIANEESRRILSVRSATVRALRAAFERRGFVEVETPMLQVKPGGALARPFVTHHNVLGRDMFLRIAPELYLKRLTVGGLEKVFEVNRNFRNEGISPLHNPEFTMLESYEAFVDYEHVLAMTEEVVAETAQEVLGATEFEYQGRKIDLTPPWKRIDYVASVVEATGIEFSADMPSDETRARAAELGVEVETGGTGKILEQLWEHFVEPQLWAATAVMDFPVEISPLARRHRHRPELVERWEGFVGGREIANAFSELNDPVEQRARFEAQARARAGGDEEAHPVDEDYLRALEYGLPPAGGLGLGVDRLVMLLADVATIREVILFPHMRPEGS